jgi:glycosyltransferase involved in cell wall biosynthesis
MSACWKNLPFFSSLRSAHPATPMIHVEHSYSERFTALKVQNRDRFDDLLNLTYALFDKVAAVSTPQFEWISRRGFCQADQLICIPSCVALAPFFAVSGIVPTGPYKIACIGRFHEQKGFDIIVDAFVSANPKDMELVMVGDGPLRSHLMAKAAGHPNIKFKGSTKNPAIAMAECDAVAMPSRWEPYGLVALEAMAAGRTVFCAPADGLRQHIAAGATAVPENTSTGWQQILTSPWLMQRGKSALPPSSVISAEALFINRWNMLVKELLENNEQDQQAA